MHKSLLANYSSVLLNKKIIFLAISVIASTTALFLFFMWQYSSPKTIFSAAKNRSVAPTLQNNEAKLAIIHQIEKQQYKQNHKSFNNKEFAIENNMQKMQQTITKLQQQLTTQKKNNFSTAASAAISVIDNVQNNSNWHKDNYHTVASHQMTTANNAPNPIALATATNEYNLQNNLYGKKQFLAKAQQEQQKTIFVHMHNSYPYTLNTGTLISATLVTAINSDLPGNILARVNRNIYDSITGNYLLIPQGSTLIGKYDAQLSYGQSRILLAWNKLIFPNGNSINLLGMPSINAAGQTGLHDKVNAHYGRIFGTSALLSIIGAVGQLSQKTEQKSSNTSQTVFNAVGTNLLQTSAQLMQKNMNIQPTISIRAGTEFNIFVNTNMEFNHAYK